MLNQKCQNTPTTPSANETLNNEELVNIIREVVKEEFADHEKKFSEILKSHLETTNQRLNEISGEVLELTKSLEFTQGEVKEEITCIKDDLNQVKTDLQELGEDVLDPDYVINKLIELEDRSRRNNIRIDGIEDDQNETWDSCEEKVQKLIKEKLGLENEVEIERCHRMKKKLFLNFFNLKTQNFDTPYILPEEFKKFHDTSCDDSFSILHLNIRSIKKDFENFKLFFSTLGYSFSVICFSETWLDDTDSNSLYELPNYISKHQIRDDRKGGGVSFYIHNSLSFRVLPNLCINSTDIESLSIEISLNDLRNTLVNVLYRPPSGKIEPLENFWASFFLLFKIQIKTYTLLVILTLI